MSNPDLNPTTPPQGFYTPGYSKMKLLMMAYGFSLFVFGLSQIWTPIHLVLTGVRADAEAVSVIKTKTGVPDLKLIDDSEVRKQVEPNDRSYTFWNEFQYQSQAGELIQVRSSVGSKVKPIYTLTDGDGLPTMVRIYYNPERPQQVVFLGIISTWFASCVLVFAGLACLLIGGTLYYWSEKPIELPHIKAE